MKQLLLGVLLFPLYFSNPCSSTQSHLYLSNLDILQTLTNSLHPGDSETPSVSPSRELIPHICLASRAKLLYPRGPTRLQVGLPQCLGGQFPAAPNPCQQCLSWELKLPQ